MKTQVKGDLAVTRAIFVLTSMGYNIAIPITESAQYDLIAENSTGIFKVQVKYSEGNQVDLRRIHSNSQGYVVKKYSGSFDWLFVYSPKLGDFLLKQDLSGRSTVNLKDKDKI